MFRKALAFLATIAIGPVALADRRYPPDGNDGIVWTFDETGFPFANSGNGGTLNLTLSSGTGALYSGRGILAGNGLVSDAQGYSVDAVSSTTSIGESSIITWSAWVEPLVYPCSTCKGTILNKASASSGTAASASMSLDGTGQLVVSVQVGGSACTTASGTILPLGVPSFVGFTFNYGTVAIYRNGVQVKSGTCGTSIDWGSHGAYHVGGFAAAGGQGAFLAIVDEIRVSSADHTYGSWWRDVYSQGMAITQEPWNHVGASGQPAFQNSWTNFGGGYLDAAFYKDSNGRVWLRGLIRGGTPVSTIFTLPAGYVPSGRIDVIATYGEVSIFANGEVKAEETSGGDIGLDGISFDTR